VLLGEGDHADLAQGPASPAWSGTADGRTDPALSAQHPCDLSFGLSGSDLRLHRHARSRTDRAVVRGRRLSGASAKVGHHAACSIAGGQQHTATAAVLSSSVDRGDGLPKLLLAHNRSIATQDFRHSSKTTRRIRGARSGRRYERDPKRACCLNDLPPSNHPRESLDASVETVDRSGLEAGCGPPRLEGNTPCGQIRVRSSPPHPSPRDRTLSRLGPSCCGPGHSSDVEHQPHGQHGRRSFALGAKPRYTGCNRYGAAKTGNDQSQR
jgi:hypothetical protein